jgi:hypothetical protein
MDRRKHVFVGHNASGSKIVETFADGVEVLLLKREEVVERLSNEFFTPPASVRCECVKRDDLRWFEFDLKQFSHDFYLPPTKEKSQVDSEQYIRSSVGISLAQRRIQAGWMED